LNCGSYSAAHSLHFSDLIAPISNNQHSLIYANK
jgi:hypothetical protein